jgi:uncharacterized ParB-like nuclease family protein
MQPTIIATDLHLTQIVADPAMQGRISMNEDAVIEYADALKEGMEFPPVLIMDTGDQMLLYDGFHRLEAHKRANSETIACVIRPGTRSDAMWLAAAANAKHGVRRTNEDKRKSVMLAISSRPDASLRELAKHCGVTHEMVRQLKLALERPMDNGLTPAEQVTLAGPSVDRFGKAEAEYAKISVAVGKAFDAVIRLAQSKHGAHLDSKAVQAAITKVMNSLNKAAPARVCPDCNGDGCAPCRQTGWIPKVGTL